MLPFEDGTGLPIADIFTPLLIEEDPKAKERIQTPDSPSGRELQSMKELFYFGRKPAKRIIMKGEAGFGKTMFCLKLLDIWCQVKQSETVTDDALSKCLAMFDLVFYVPLRHCTGNVTSVKDMICNMVSMQCLNVLRTGQTHCLVILDGLDELSSPLSMRELPSMQGLMNCVLFCTTRPWKLTQLHLTFKSDDKVVQILGLLPSNTKKVIEYVLVNLYKVRRQTYEFTEKCNRYSSMLQYSSLASLIKIPMMLTACCCMWYEEDMYSEQTKLRNTSGTKASPTVQSSMTYIFSSLLESMIRRADAKYDLKSLFPHVQTSCHSRIPKILAKFQYISSYINALLPLCQLAYRDLVSNETKLVFHKDELEREIGVSLVQIALKIGLINQTKAPGRFHEQNVSINFYHKTIQEFMAAIHLTSTDTDDVSLYCTSVDRVLEVADIIKFVLGLKPELGCSVCKRLKDTIDKDSEILSYRETLSVKYSGKIQQLCPIQRQWFRELRYNQTVTGDNSSAYSMHVSDIYLEGSSLRCSPHEPDRDFITKELICSSLHSIVSLRLWSTSLDPNDVWQYLPRCTQLSALCINDNHELNRYEFEEIMPLLTNLESILFYGDVGRMTITAIVEVVLQLTHLKYLQLWKGSIDDDVMVIRSDMKNMQILRLGEIKMSASGWDKFISSLLTLQQSVLVSLDSTNIDEKTVSKIITSPRFTLPQKVKTDSRGVYKWLEFTTVPSHTREGISEQQ